ncbi:MAG: hypothetical protein ACRBC3_23010 [Burkholderiaceae bacterium]
MTDAKDASGTPLEPTTQFITQDQAPRIAFYESPHGSGAYSIAFAPGAQAAVSFLEDKIIHRNYPLPTVAIGRSDESLAAMRQFHQLFFEPGATWSVSDTDPKVLTIIGSNLAIFSLQPISPE